jgi:uncharacterized circularly permuted ATP-grasp superfamily protein
MLTQAPFQNYWYGAAWDEMFHPGGEPRLHYEPLMRVLEHLPADEIRQKKQAADLSFLHQGITFTVYGKSEGTERIFPHDLIPRILTAAEWSKIELGLPQRITALNEFLRDIYHEQPMLLKLDQFLRDDLLHAIELLGNVSDRLEQDSSVWPDDVRSWYARTGKTLIDVPMRIGCQRVR